METWRGQSSRFFNRMAIARVSISSIVKSSWFLCNFRIARSTNSLWFGFVRTMSIVVRRRLKVLSDLLFIPSPHRIDNTKMDYQNPSSYRFHTTDIRVDSFLFLLVLKKIQQFAKNTLFSSKVAYITIQSSPTFSPMALSIVVISPTKRLCHPWHLWHWSTIDIFTGQLTSTLGLLDTFVTITIAFRHFQTSKHVLQTTHILTPSRL
jgi:hypothetical protein